MPRHRAAKGDLTKGRSKPKAFSLLELLVVIGILGILSALLLPLLSQAKARTHATVCRNHLRQLGLALAMYVHDHQSRYPYYVGPLDPWDNSAVELGDPRSYWWSKLFPYAPVKWADRAYHCPGYKGRIAERLAPGPRAYPEGAYAYNLRGVRPLVVGYDDPGRRIHARFPNVAFGLDRYWLVDPPTAESQVVVPSEMLAIGESRFLNASANESPGGRDELTCGWLSWRNPQEAFDPARHGRNYFSVFCDGHVAGMSPWVLFSPSKTAPLWNYDHQPHQELWLP